MGHVQHPNLTAVGFAEPVRGGVRLNVRATPRSRREAIEGLETDSAGHARLKVRVSAPPAEGEANERIVRLLAKALGRPPSAITLAKGAHARNKTFEIAGDAEDLMARLHKLAGAP
ncbi:MAG: DUF167 family protein [Alphaproteobacteria bacterium]